MSNRDYVRFQYMLDASQAAAFHLLDKTREDLDHNRLLLNGIVRELEILGEAASRISPAVREQFPSLPWKEMIGLRNRLIHAYFDVNNQAIWLVVKESLPPLILQLQEILRNWVHQTSIQTESSDFLESEKSQKYQKGELKDF